MVALSATHLVAQSRPTLEILIEKLSDEAAQCGVIESTLRTPAALTLRNNRLSVSNERTDPYLHLVVTVLYMPNINSCAFSSRVSIRSAQSARVRNYLRSNKFEDVILCNNSVIFFGARNNVPKELAETVATQVADCLADIDY